MWSLLGKGVRPCMLVALPLLILAVLALGGIYSRLLLGPVVLDSLSRPIVAAINADLKGLTATIDHLEARLSKVGGIELQLRNIRLVDETGALVAVAPQAAVELSSDALWQARLQPARIVLIEPRMIVFYSERDGLSLSFGRPGRDAKISGAPAQPLSDDADTAPLDTVAGRIDVARALAKSAIDARKNGTLAPFLRQIGVRDATVILDMGGEQSLWRVPDAQVELEQSASRSLVTGALKVASAKGPWSLDFRAEASDTLNAVSINAEVHDLVPAVLRASLPQLQAFTQLNAPLNASLTLELSSEGELRKGAGIIDIGQGQLLAEETSSLPLAIDQGHVEMRYQRGSGRIEIAPVRIAAGQNHVQLSGALAQVPATDGQPEAWQIDLKLDEGILSAGPKPTDLVALERLTFNGRYRPIDQSFNLAGFEARAAGGAISCAGQISMQEAAAQAAPTLPPAPNLACKLQPMTLTVAKAFWPRALAPGARDFVDRNLRTGRIVSGALKVSQAPPPARAGADADGTVSLVLELADLGLSPTRGLPPIDAPRALLNLAADQLEITVPDAVMSVERDKRLQLKAGKFVVPDVYAGKPDAVLDVRVLGSLATALTLVTSEALGGKAPNEPVLGLLDGKADGQLKLTFPLTANFSPHDLHIEGVAKVTEGQSKQPIGGYDISGAAVAIQIGRDAIDANGDLLIAGVPAKLAWQRVYGAAADKQPPLRITTRLDAADRAALKLETGQVLTGDIPVEIWVRAGENGQSTPHVRADLTATEIAVDGLAWRKAGGDEAVLDFDIVKSPKGLTQIQNLKLAGTNITAEGTLFLDAQGRLKEIQLPTLGLNTVSRLDVRGTLRTDNVWDVRVKGQTFDGKDFFRALFSVGRVKDQPANAKTKDTPGIDLKADIDTVLGYGDASLRNVRLEVSKRNDKLSALLAKGTLDSGKPLEVWYEGKVGETRRMVAVSEDAGRVFKLSGFYPNLQGGRMRLAVDLDGQGLAEKTGLLEVKRFDILGDAIVADVLQVPGEPGAVQTPQARAGKPKLTRQVIEFDYLKVPFLVGNGQFVIKEGEIKGPLVGAVIRGKADFRAEQLNLGGTYVPLQGLLGAPGFIPGLGLLMAGPKGEGMFGVTFAIEGSMRHPQVIVNPLSLMAPGIFREMFQLTNPDPRITAPSDRQPLRPKVKGALGSTPAGPSIAPSGGNSPAGGWSSQTKANEQGSQR